MMKPTHLKAILFLTLGWFGLDMAVSIDSTQFQRLLGVHLTDAKWIALILCQGPLAGIIVQPLMGAVSDQLLERGISRRRLLQISVILTIASILLFALPLNLALLITSIGIFYACLNLAIVNYRALITETCTRQSLLPFKGTVSGFVALFSGLGGFSMFMLSSLVGDAPKFSSVPVVGGAAILLFAFSLLFLYSPKPKSPRHQHLQELKHHQEHDLSKNTGLLSPWNFLFYLFPWLSLMPNVEEKTVHVGFQKPIFRLFTVVFSMWFAVAVMRFFFVMFATKKLGLSFSEANIPMTFFTVGMLIVSLPLGKLADRVDNRLLLRSAILLYFSAALFGYLFVDALWSACLMMALMGAGFAGVMALPLSMLFKLCPLKGEGTYLGLYNVFICVPQIYGLLLTGWLLDMTHDYRVIPLTAAVCMVIALVVSQRLEQGATDKVIPMEPLSEASLRA